MRTGSERWLRGYIWSGLMCLETQGPRGGRQTLDLGGAAEGLTHGRLASAHISRLHAGHAGGGGLRRGAYRMGVQAETWGWALGQPMGLRWGVQGVDRASKRRGRAPVGSVRLAILGKGLNGLPILKPGRPGSRCPGANR